MKLKLGTTGMVVGLFFSFIHVIWLALVFFGLGQILLDWVMGLHLLNSPFVLLPFNFGAAFGLIVLTFLMGYVMGWVFAYIWNYLYKGR